MGNDPLTDKSMKAKPIICLALAVLLSGCMSTTVVNSTIKPIVVKEPCRRSHFGGSFELPPGVYEPDFQSEQGVYYRAPAKLVNHALGMNVVQRGGLFIPFPKSKDQRQGAWIDHQEGGGGLLGFGTTSNKRIFRFSEPVPYETQK